MYELLSSIDPTVVTFAGQTIEQMIETMMLPTGENPIPLDSGGFRVVWKRVTEIISGQG